MRYCAPGEEIQLLVRQVGKKWNSLEGGNTSGLGSRHGSQFYSRMPHQNSLA
jgi:hypothetical protein